MNLFRFLQCEETEKDKIEAISNALKHARPITVTLTNVKKSGLFLNFYSLINLIFHSILIMVAMKYNNKGEKFQNLCNIKPIFDEVGNYSFVLAVQVRF